MLKTTHFALASEGSHQGSNNQYTVLIVLDKNQNDKTVDNFYGQILALSHKPISTSLLHTPNKKTPSVGCLFILFNLQSIACVFASHSPLPLPLFFLSLPPPRPLSPCLLV